MYTSEIDASKIGIMFGKGLTDLDMKRLNKSFSNPVTEKEFRNLALFLVMSRTGLRAKEIVGLKFSDMVTTPEGDVGFRYIRKGGKVRITLPGAEAIQAVKEYHRIAGIQADDFFLSLPNRARKGERTNLTTRGLQMIVNSWGVTSCNGKMVHPHSIRHTAGQKIMDQAGSLAAQILLGHSSPATTGRFYLRPYYDGTKILRW